MTRTLPLLLLTACATPFVADTGGAPEAAEACEAWVTDTWPVQGSTAAYYRDAISFALSAPTPDAVVIAPVEGQQTVSDDGLTVTFTPHAPLEPATDYVFGLDLCGHTPQLSFTTSRLGEPLPDAAWLVGMTYAVDPLAGRFVDGGMLGEILAGAFGRQVLLQITELSDDGLLSARAAISRPSTPAQDDCYRTLELDGIALETADFSYAAQQTEVGFMDGLMRFFELQVSGTFSPDLTWAGGVAVSVLVDVDSVQELVQLDEPEAICDFAEELGAPCGPCPVEPLHDCVAIGVVGMDGVGVEEELIAVSETCE